MDSFKERDHHSNFKTSISKDEPEEVKVEEVKVEKVKFGYCDCALLNVRKEPSKNSDIVVVINHKSELKILSGFKNELWYKIVTATGDEGYVMKEFVVVKE